MVRSAQKDGFETTVAGVVPTPGDIEYYANGAVGHFNNVTDYFRSCAAEGKATIVHIPDTPLKISALHKLLSYAGTRVPKVMLFALRYTTLNDPNPASAFAALELNDVNIASVRQVTGDSGRTFYLAEFHATPGSGKVS